MDVNETVESIIGAPEKYDVVKIAEKTIIVGLFLIFSLLAS